MTNRLFTRREIVRGLAAAPVLGPMLRASRAAAQGASGVRFCTLAFGNGVHPGWVPPETGAPFTLPAHIAPLDAIRGDVLILKNLNHQVGGHNNGMQAILTGWDVHQQPSNRNSNYNDWLSETPSIDQVIADRIAASTGRTPVHSLQLSNMQDLGSSNGGRIAFTNTTPALPLSPVNEPLKVYQQLAGKLAGGTGVDPNQLRLAIAARKSLLDSVIKDDLGSLRRRMSPADCRQCDAYETALRQVEAGLGNVYQPPSGASCKAATVAAPPPGQVTRTTSKQYQTYLDLHLGLVTFAFGCGLTRVATVQLCKGSINPYPWDWSPDMGVGDFHGQTHYIALAYSPADSQKRAERTTRAQAYWTQQLVNFVKQLKALPDGATGSVLDNSIVLLATQNGDSNIHSPRHVPYVLAGGAGGPRFKTGRVVDCGERYNNDVLVSIANAMGLVDLTRFGDGNCKGALPGLAG